MAGNVAFEPDGYPGCFAFLQQHADDFRGCAVTEELTQLLLVIRDVVLFHQVDEVLRWVPGQGGDAEKRVLGLVVLGGCRPIGEVTAPASGDQYFLAGPVSVLQDQDSASPLSGLHGAHQTSCPRADDGYVVAFRSPPASVGRGRPDPSGTPDC